jgi:hypothetical protein
MSSRVFFFNRLRDGVEPEAYEEWVRTVDYPFARGIPAIVSYEVVRIEGPLRDSGVDYDYVEVVEVTDVDDYRRDLSELLGREAFVAELRSFVGPADAVYGTTIE